MDQYPRRPEDTGEIVRPQIPPPPHVAEFMNRLRSVGPRQIAALPDMTPSVDHSGGEISHPDVVARLNHAYVDRAIVSPESTDPPNRLAFEYKPGWGLGRQESQHQTFFGMITVEEADGSAREVPVAVKEFPFEIADRAVQECALLQDLAARGLPAVRPVGMVTDRWKPAPSVYLIIGMEQDLESLNAQDWSGVRPEDVPDRVAPLIDTFRMLHENGIFNPELAFGNIGIGEAAESRFIFDLETAVSLRHILDGVGPNDPVPEALQIALRLNFQAARVSLRKFVYPNLTSGQRPAAESREEFDLELSWLYEPYHEAIARSASPYRNVLERAYRTMLEQRRSELAQRDQEA